MKKVILAVLATATMGTTLVAPLMANAREAHFGHNPNTSFLQARVTYAVFYKKSRFGEWSHYGSYSSKLLAKATVLRLEVQGYEAYYAIPRG